MDKPLHVDMPADGMYTFNGMNMEDGPVQDGMGMVIAPPFDVTVPAGTPAVRLTTINIGPTAYNWTGVEPAAFAAPIGMTPDNQTLTLRPDWRYEIVNNAFPGHPLELVTLGAMRSADTVIFSQQMNNDGTLESDTATDWVETSNSVLFNATTAFQNAVTGYRCSVAGHVNMRGGIVYQ